MMHINLFIAVWLAELPFKVYMYNFTTFLLVFYSFQTAAVGGCGTGREKFKSYICKFSSGHSSE